MEDVNQNTRSQNKKTENNDKEFDAKPMIFKHLHIAYRRIDYIIDQINTHRQSMPTYQPTQEEMSILIIRIRDYLNTLGSNKRFFESEKELIDNLLKSSNELTTLERNPYPDQNKHFAKKLELAEILFYRINESHSIIDKIMLKNAEYNAAKNTLKWMHPFDTLSDPKKNKEEISETNVYRNPFWASSKESSDNLNIDKLKACLKNISSLIESYTDDREKGDAAALWLVRFMELIDSNDTKAIKALIRDGKKIAYTVTSHDENNSGFIQPPN